MRKITRGYGKYKDKLPFKCFNFGRVGNFVAWCSYAKSEDNDDEYINDEE